jgi:hypothetical protein
LINSLRLFVMVMCFTARVTPAFAQSSSTDSGWTTTVYPLYAWLPVFGADVRLPEVPNPPPCDGCGSGGPITPGGSVSSNLNGAAFAAVTVENRWVQIDASFLWAGLSASADRPRLSVKADTILGAAQVGVRVVPDLFVDVGVRRVALNVRASALVFDEVQWKPGLWESLVGASYTPRLSPSWRLIAHADYGGLEANNHSTISANASVQWKPASHLVLNLGYGLLKLTVDGNVLLKPIHLDQTLHGPVIGIGIPF